MAGTKAHGTRVYFAASGTAWVALAAAAYPTTGYTQITRLTDTDVTPHEVETNDNSCLNDTSPSPEVILKPGKGTFSKEKDSQTHTLRGMCDGATKYVFAFVYSDGTADVGEGYLTCGGVKASKGFANRVGTTFNVAFDSSGVLAKDHA
jgi:hypothetical protein